MKHDNYSTQSKPVLKIANSRGRRPVLREIQKARKILDDLLIEINPCAGKEAMQECVATLTSILAANV
jgi:hypothetical protein